MTTHKQTSTQTTHDSQIKEMLKHAEEQGICPPVLTWLDPSCRAARAIYSDIHEEDLPKPASPGWGRDPPMELLSVPDAVQLFKKRASIAGAAIANLLRDPPLDPAYWKVFLFKHKMAVVGTSAKGSTINGSVCYQSMPLARPSRGIVRWPGSVTLQLQLNSGAVASVQSRSIEDAEQAAVLVRLAADKLIPLISLEENASFPVDADLLSLILHRHFGNCERVVAEAVRSLRSLDGMKDCPMLEVLEKYATIRTGKGSATKT